ncbi:MAG: hypothetical protein ACLQBQ_13350, partial [Smithella sp.]
HTHETNSQDDNSLNGLRIINYGDYVLPEPYDIVNYYIDGKKVASHNADKKFETLIQLSPGEYHLIVENGSYYNCKYSFKIDRGQIGTFNNYNYNTYVMYKADREEADKAEHYMADLEPWGFQKVNSQIMEKKVGGTGCSAINNDIGRKICREYHDNLCR